MKKLSKKIVSKWSLKAPLFVDKKDKRYARYAEQLKTNGFSDTETWGLDSVICEFILPRLIRFKEVNNGYPFGLTPEKWDTTIDQMIFAFEWSLNCEDKKYEKLTDEEKKTNWLKYEVGIQLFSKHFRDLWW